MAIRSQENVIAAWAFTIGTIIAVVVGAFVQNNIAPVVFGILSILGLVVGYFVAEKDVKTFLMASVSLVLVSFAGLQGIGLAEVGGINISAIVKGVMSSLMAMFVPATIVVVIKTVFSIAKN